MDRNTSLTYRVVDVFTKHPLEGNPLAVFPDGRGVDDHTMQGIARELNLSETVFVLPSTRPDCAARLRIFTPMREIPFAGHPTVGAAYVLMDESLVDRNTPHFHVEEGVGPVPVRVEPGDAPLIWLTTPPIEAGPVFDPALCADVLGLRAEDLAGAPPQLFSAGNPTIFVALKNRDAVDRAALDSSGMKRLRGTLTQPLCVFVFSAIAEGAWSRMFAPDHGIIEDPATGSSTGPLAAYMIRNGLASGSGGSGFVSEQGTKMGRRSLLHVLIHGENGREGIEVGGYVTPLTRAVMTL